MMPLIARPAPRPSAWDISGRFPLMLAGAGSHWRSIVSGISWRWCRLGIAGLAIVVGYAPTLMSLAREWATFPTLSHGFAIPLISMYLIWRRRHLAQFTSDLSWRGLPVVISGLGLYAAGTLAATESFIARISFPVTLFGVVLLLGGAVVARALLPGLGYLFFMIPLPWSVLKELTGPATLIDATVTTAVSTWFGVPVLREGTVLYLPNITLEVADACSSVPSIASLLALGAAYGLARGRSGPVCLVLLLAAFPLGALANLVRIIMTVLGTYHLGPVVLGSALHMWNGTVVFLMTSGALVLLDCRLVRARPLRAGMDARLPGPLASRLLFPRSQEGLPTRPTAPPSKDPTSLAPAVHLSIPFPQTASPPAGDPW